MIFVNRKFCKHFQSKPTTCPAIRSLVKKLDVTRTVDLPRLGELVAAITAEHQTGLVALIAQGPQKSSKRLYTKLRCHKLVQDFC